MIRVQSKDMTARCISWFYKICHFLLYHSVTIKTKVLDKEIQYKCLMNTTYLETWTKAHTTYEHELKPPKVRNEEKGWATIQEKGRRGETKSVETTVLLKSLWIKSMVSLVNGFFPLFVSSVTPAVFNKTESKLKDRSLELFFFFQLSLSLSFLF